MKKRTRYGETWSSLPTNDEDDNETQLSDRIGVFTCKTTDRACFVKRTSPYSYNTTWYIFILFGRAVLLEINK